MEKPEPIVWKIDATDAPHLKDPPEVRQRAAAVLLGLLTRKRRKTPKRRRGLAALTIFD